MKLLILLSTNGDDAILTFFAVTLGVVLYLFLAKAIMGFGAMLKQSKLQTNNLRIMRTIVDRLAEKQGMTREELNEIHDMVTSENPINQPCMRRRKAQKFDERKLYNDRIYWGWQDLKTKLLLAGITVGIILIIQFIASFF